MAGAQVRIGRWTVHRSLTLEVVSEAVERQQTSLDCPGFCLACGEEDTECDPDTTDKDCESCGETAVYGAAEILMHMV